MNAAPTGEPVTSHRLLAGRGGRALAVLTALELLTWLDRLVASALVESLRADLWLTDVRLGSLMTAVAVAYALAAPRVRPLADRQPRARLLAAAVAVGSLASLLSGAARGYWSLLAARAAAGLGQAAHSAIAAGVRAGDPGRAAGHGRRRVPLASLPAGAALGYVVGGLVDRALGWRAAFAFAGAAGLVLAFACLRLEEPGAAAPARARAALDGAGAVATWRRLAGHRGWTPIVLGYAAYGFAVAAMAFWMPAFLERARGVPRPVATVQLGTIVLMTGLLGAFAGARAADALRARRLPEPDLWVCGVATLAAAPCALAAFLTWRPGFYLVALVLAQLLLFAPTGPVAAALAARVPPAERASAVALALLALQLLGAAPSPALVGLLSDRTSLGRALLVVPAAILVAGTIWTWAAWRGDGRGVTTA